MSFARLRAFAATRPGATRDIRWGADEVQLESASALPLAEAKVLTDRSHALVAATPAKKAREAALGSSR